MSNIMDISTEANNVVHPIDSRYKVKEMNLIWEEENQMRQQMKVEVALSKAISEMKPELVTPEEVTEIEQAIGKTTLKRAKEIGLRKAVGATNSAILFQFLMHSKMNPRNLYQQH